MNRCRHCTLAEELWRHLACVNGSFEHAPWPDLHYVTDDYGRMVKIN